MAIIDPLFFEYQKTKDVKTRNKLVEKNIRLAYKIAHQIHEQTRFNFEELRQEALLTLIKVVEKYDPAIGGFSTYAVIKIKGNLFNYLRDKSTLIRVPRGYHEVQRKWNQAKNQLTKKIKRLPTMQEIAEFSGIKLESYLKAEQVVNQCRSIGDLNVTLDSPINQRFEDFMKEIVCNYSKLSTFQQQILTLFVFQNLTIRDICKVTEQSKQDIKTALIEACNLAELTIN